MHKRGNLKEWERESNGEKDREIERARMKEREIECDGDGG